MAHNHDHHHHHGHGEAPKDFSNAFVFGIILNFGFVIVEATYGYFANSLALMSDAGHNLSDVLGLSLAFAAIFLARKKPSQKFTYGYKSSTILASLLNATILLIAVGGIIVEAFQRFNHPELINENMVMVVACVGILVNGLTAMLFFSGRKGDLNIRGAFLHMLADALVSVGVVISALLIRSTGWVWLDSAVSLAIAFVIVLGTWRLLKDSLSLALDGVPAHIHINDVKLFLERTSGVSHVHHLHIWAISTTDVALTAHLVTPEGHPGNDFLNSIAKDLKKNFHIEHVTLQIETGESLDPHCSSNCSPDEQA